MTRLLGLESVTYRTPGGQGIGADYYPTRTGRVASTILVSWQQPTRAQLEMFPTADRQKDPRVFYTTTQVAIRGTITRGSDVYRILQVGEWPMLLDHYECLAVKDDPSA